MADWGKGLYAVALQGPGTVLDLWHQDHEPSLRERLHPKALFKMWMPRCRSMRKEERVSNHGLHLLKVVKTYKVFIWTGKLSFCWTSILWRILFHSWIHLLLHWPRFSAFSLPLSLSFSSSSFSFTGCFCLATRLLDCGESRRWLCAPRSGRCAWGVPPCAGHRLRREAGSRMSPSPSGWLVLGKWHSHWLMQTCLTAHWRPGSGRAQW